MTKIAKCPKCGSKGSLMVKPQIQRHKLKDGTVRSYTYSWYVVEHATKHGKPARRCHIGRKNPLLEAKEREA